MLHSIYLIIEIFIICVIIIWENMVFIWLMIDFPFCLSIMFLKVKDRLVISVLVLGDTKNSFV